MHFVVTAGPTYETMDNVRRLTNFSTGRLGTELANHLVAAGYQVTLLIGEQATHSGERRAQRVEPFSTTANLLEKFRALSQQRVDAVCHAAAVSDYTFGKIWLRAPTGEMAEIKSGKIATRAGTLLAELVPTPKIIAELRGLFPNAKLVGWKYEVDGDRVSVLAAAERQLRECHTDACVANGKAYGLGFGVVTGPGECVHHRDMVGLFSALTEFVSRG
jgi:phosphopantothenoylcysteine decarboxylase/phosphopantothenate--cysteine ligase